MTSEAARLADVLTSKWRVSLGDEWPFGDLMTNTRTMRCQVVRARKTSVINCHPQPHGACIAVVTLARTRKHLLHSVAGIFDCWSVECIRSSCDARTCSSCEYFRDVSAYHTNSELPLSYPLCQLSWFSSGWSRVRRTSWPAAHHDRARCITTPPAIKVARYARNDRGGDYFI